MFRTLPCPLPHGRTVGAGTACAVEFLPTLLKAAWSWPTGEADLSREPPCNQQVSEDEAMSKPPRASDRPAEPGHRSDHTMLARFEKIVQLAPIGIGIVAADG